MSSLFSYTNKVLKISPAVKSQYLKVPRNNLFIKRHEGVYGQDLGNGVKMSCGGLKNQTIGACTIMYQAGSRDEYDETLGATHFMRAGSFTDGYCFSQYAKCRYMLQQGGKLTMSSDRQTIAYTLRCPSVEFSDLVSFLNDSGVRVCYPDWQLNEVRRLVRHELQTRDPEAQVLDLLQRACFAGPLSNSIYCEQSSLGGLKHLIVRYGDDSVHQKVCYPDWQLNEVRRLVRHELQTRDPEAQVLDLLQRACFAGPLSNSIYCEEERVSTFNNEKLCSFSASVLKPERCTVGSWGLPCDQVTKLAQGIGRSLTMSMSKEKRQCSTKSSYRSGYETADLGKGKDTYIAVGVPGAGFYHFKEMVTLSILAAACGTGPERPELAVHHDYSNYLPLSKLSQNDPRINYKAFNISHSDLGIFGVLVKTCAKHARNCGFSLMEFLKTISEVTEGDVMRGKRRLALNLACETNDVETASYSLALSASMKGGLNEFHDYESYIHSITYPEVQTMARNIASHFENGKMGVAVCGDVAAAPNDCELRDKMKK